MKKKSISAITKFFATVLTAGLILTLLLNVFTLWSVGEIKRGKSVEFGYFCAIIGSGSMEPILSKNDLLLIKGVRSYQIEDIVTYVSPRGALVTHRIKELSEQGFITQGDANNIPDEAISGQRVLGRVVFVLPGAGSIIDGVLSPAGIILLSCMFLLVCLVQRIRRDQNEDEQGNTRNTFDDISNN